ncbi:MAG TPA: hypothetical protein VF588_15145 [Pyrinomonadaceae bacterium]|jgi:hypothetical protein
MSDLEVESTLREIRERVLAEAQARAPEASAVTTLKGAAAPATQPAAGAGANGAGAGEALARMDANLATTGRAWSRLPPMLSYRRGAAARLELWLKRLVARAARWFTWEQVNFNSAVHHALGDARAALNAHEQALARLQSEILSALRAEGEADRARVSELQARLAQAEARFESQGAQLRQAFAAGLERLADAQRASASEMRTELRAELGDAQRAESAEINARAEELHAELQRRVDGLLDEQRVCFKQLSLEAGEAAVMHDRARRQLEARLEALETKAATAEVRLQRRGGGGPESPP